MAVTDQFKAVEDAIGDLLLADADFVRLTKVSNVFFASDPARQRSMNPKAAKMPADFGKRAGTKGGAEVVIDRGASSVKPFRPAVTFGTFGAAPCPRIEERTQDFTVTITSDDKGDAAAGEVQACVEAAIINGGPQLGLAAAVRLVEEISGRHELTDRGTAAGVVRRVVTLTVRVAMRAHV